MNRICMYKLNVATEEKLRTLSLQLYFNCDFSLVLFHLHIKKFQINDIQFPKVR